MNPSYILASVRELAILSAILLAVHFAIEMMFGVHVLAVAWHDFLTLPVPSWTWPTWLVFALLVVIVLIEVIFRVSIATEKQIRGHQR